MAELLTCPECGGEVLPQGDREQVCAVCGLVIERVVCDEKYVNFTSADHHERFTTATGNPLRSRGNRVHVKTHKDRRDDTLYHLIQSFDAPDYIRRTAMDLARRFFRAGGDVRTIGSYEDFIIALMHLSYRVCREVPQLDTGDAKKVQTKASRIYWTIKNGGIRIPQVTISPSAQEWVPVIARGLGRPEIIDEALKVLAQLPPRSHTPQTRAAASVYRVLELRGENITYKEIAELTGINPSTLSKCCKQLFGEEEKEKKSAEQETQIPVKGIAASEWLTVLHLTLNRLARLRPERR